MTNQDCKPVPPRIQSLIGDRYGRWLVVGYAGRREVRHFWNCLCDCGNEGIIRTDKLTGGLSKSCGCQKSERLREKKIATKHGMTNAPEYYVWHSMRSRCLNPKNAAYKNYGGRGITVCKRWRDSFENFYKDMGPRPTPKHTIERIDNDKGYSPDNCKWATREDQNRNKRGNRFLVIDGITRRLREWANEYGISGQIITTRLFRGWTPERAVKTPVTKKGD